MEVHFGQSTIETRTCLFSIGTCKKQYRNLPLITNINATEDDQRKPSGGPLVQTGDVVNMALLIDIIV
eukprot:scaffold38987_cov20-Prasinocladus_malaysianus.AAC.1